MEYNEEALEKCLPKYLEKDLKRFKEGKKNNQREISKNTKSSLW